MYDFEGDTENGELVLKEGEVLTITNKDIGDGWWEAEVNNVVGLVPESYCELLDGAARGSSYDNDTGGGDDWQDEWDDHERDGHADVITASASQSSYRAEDKGSNSGGSRPISPGQQSGSIAGRHGTVKKNINRFSPFVKTGTESFVLHSLSVKRDVRANETIKIVVSEGGRPMWEPSPEPYLVEVRDPEKRSKFKGIKSFIAYHIIPSHTNTGVSRRYKHYDWLHDRLVEKFPMLSVPPLPDKQFDRRFGEEFVEKRKDKLAMWTNRIARHPVLSRSQVIHHFLTCPEGDEKEWKAGKRRAERDEMVAGCWYLTVQPEASVEIQQVDSQVERFGHFQRVMDEVCVRMRNKFMDHCNKMSGPITQEFNRMAAVIGGLSHCFQMETNQYCDNLTRAIEDTSAAYHEIAEMHTAQPKRDMLPTLDRIKEYLGILQEFPDVVDIHKGALSKVRDCERMKEEGRIDFMEASDITSRAEKVSVVVMAEMYHFHRERVVDFRDMMKFFLQEQIDFYKRITARLESSLARYSESTDL